MYEIHRGIGEGLFLIYLILMGVVYFMGRSGRDVPAWLTGVSHGILALQVAVGVILLAEGHSVVWYHPVLGIAAMLAIGLTPVLRQRLGRTNGTVVVLGIIAALTLAARLAVM